MDTRYVKSFNISSIYAQFGERVIMAFGRQTDKGQPLITSLEDELEMVIPTKDAGTIKIRFKPKDFVDSLNEI